MSGALKLLLLVALIVQTFALEATDADFFLDHPTSMSMGFHHVCTISQRHNDEDVGGEAHCFGLEGDDSGKLEPPKDTTFVQVIIGQHYGCGLQLDQTVLCWGGLEEFPPKGMFKQISASGLYACGVMIDDTVSCWGHTPRWKPVPSEVGYVHVDCSDTHCCAIDKMGVPTCFSERDPLYSKNSHLRPPSFKRSAEEIAAMRNARDAEEDGYDDEENEVDIYGNNIQFRSISVSSNLSCGITHSRDIQCFGKSKWIGDDRFIKGPFKMLAVGDKGLCALHAEQEEENRETEEPEESEEAEEKKKDKHDDDDEDYDDDESDEDEQNDDVEDDGEASQKKTAEVEKETAEAGAAANAATAKLNKKHEHMLECWGKPMHRILKEYGHGPQGVLDLEWDQIGVHRSSICGVTMDSEVKCFGDMDIIGTPDIIVA